MKDLYSIGEPNRVDTNKFEVEIALNPRSKVFDGHFPGQPVLPGVCLLEMLKDGIEKAMDTSIRIKRADNIKYLKMVDPAVDSILVLHFELAETEGGYSVTASTTLTDGSVNFKLKGLVA